MHNRTNITLFIGIFTVIAASTYPALWVRAAASSPCEFQNGLQDLFQKRDSYASDTSLDNLRSELDVRKVILNRILDCAVSDATKLQSSITSLSINDPDIQNIQNRLSSKFDDATRYYLLQKTLVPDLGIEGSKIFSRSLREWRISNYEPIAELGTDFVIFAKNQNLMQTAENRLNQIKTTLRVLKLTDSETIRGLLQNAEDNFAKAKKDNGDAAEIFKRLSWPNDSSNLIASSLEYLKETYQNFFDIQNEVRR